MRRGKRSSRLGEGSLETRLITVQSVGEPVVRTERREFLLPRASPGSRQIQSISEAPSPSWGT